VQDPLNRKVRALVGNAHLSHAVKQMVAYKHEAAKKEIAEAASWLTSATDQGRMHLLQAWTEPAGSPERLRLAQRAVATWGGGLAAGWRLVREARGVFARVDLTSSTGRLREAGLDTTRSLTPADLLELLTALEHEPAMVRKGFDPLAVWRKALTSLCTARTLDADTSVRLCEAFNQHQEFDLAEKVAATARQRWPDKPIFVYHAVAARAGKKKGRIPTDKDFNDLEAAQSYARQNRDLRLAARIEQLFEADNPKPDFDDLDFPDDLGLPALPLGPLSMDARQMREIIQMSNKLDGGKSFLNKAREELGDALMKQIERECGGDKKLYLSRITDLVVDALVNATAQISGRAAAKSNPPQKPVKPPMPGQKNLFNE
jgi:hypothetical protein